MKTIILVRHAKSSWEHDITDVERPLSARGFNDAKLLSKEMLRYNILPDSVYSSQAKRASATCNIFMTNLNWSSEKLKISESLYDFGGQRVQRFIHELNHDLTTVILFGHNDAFTFIANTFGDRCIENVPTCGIVKLDFENESWKTITKGTTDFTLFPKDLKF